MSRRSFLRSSLAAGAGIGAAGVLAACGSSSSPSKGSSSSAPAAPAASGASSAPSAAKGSITLIGGTAFQSIVDTFTQQTGIKVTNVNLPYDGAYQRLVSEFGSNNYTFDVAFVDEIWISQFAEKAEPLDDMFTPDVVADLFDALVKSAKYQDHYVAMPYDTNVEILLYRKDLFEDPKEMAGFKSAYGYDLAVPTDWQSFTDAARYFTRSGLWGTDVIGAEETEWLAHVLQAGSPGVILDASGNVIINNQQHIDALTFYADMYNKYKVAPSGVQQVDWAAAQNLFNQGKTSMMKFWSHAFPQLPKDSPVYGKVGTAPMIGGKAGIAGIPGPWFAMVPQGAKNKAAALEFAKFCYDSNHLFADEPQVHLAARKSVFQDYSTKPGYEYYKDIYATLNAPATMSRPATPKWQQLVDTVLIPLVQKSLTSGADYASILNDAAGKVQQVISA